MALTNAQVREILSTAGIPAENVEVAVKKIMDGHVTSINALREERDNYKADAEKLPSVQKELNDIKAKGDQDWQKKFDDEHKAFEAYKNEVTAEKVSAQKSELYRALLRELKVGEAQINSILKVTDLSKLTIKDGKLDDLEKLKETAKSEWGGFIMAKNVQGQKVDNPPANPDKNAFEKMSLADKMTYANEHPTDQSVIDWLKN